MTDICSVCKVEDSVAKYKCPTCITPYCSLSCWKLHKSKPCERPVIDKQPSPPPKHPGYYYATEDTVFPEKLSLLKNSETLKNILSNPHVRQILKSIDSSDRPADLLQTAMVEPIFVEFADECIRIVDPDSPI